MSALPDVLFVTYYRTQPVGQMGVFKRCTRLMEQLTDAYRIHLVNFGPLPERDAQFEALRDRITIHAVTDGDLPEALTRVLDGVRPRALILGEAPLRGSMRTAHRVATKLGLFQIGIENTFHRAFAPYVTAEYPAVDQWLLIGPLENGFPERLSDRVVVTPSHVRYPPHVGTIERDRVTVIGYDLRSLAMGSRLLEFLPDDEPVDFLISPAGREQLSGIDRPNMRILELPGDDVISDSIARAKYVIGKSGYGQITESLMLGAPIVARWCGGGMHDGLLASFLKPHVRVLRHELLLNGVPDLPRPVQFEGVAALIPDTVAFGARVLQSMIDGTSIELPGHNEPVDADMFDGGPGVLVGVQIFKQMLEKRRWADLRARLNGTEVWMFDRPMQPDDFIAMLDDMLRDAADIRLLLLDVTKMVMYGDVWHVSIQGALLWGERESWRDHDLALDLHIGWRGRDDGSFAYVGVTVTSKTD